jgi:hypothetical protein
VPTVHRFRGFRVVIYPNDHRPPHVHVIGADLEAIFELNCPDGPARLRENYGFSFREITQVEAELIYHIDKLCAAWRSIHGE